MQTKLKIALGAGKTLGKPELAKKWRSAGLGYISE